MTVVLLVLGTAGFVAGLMVYGVIVGTWVLAIMWAWFVTPLLGFPVPAWPLLAGLALTARYLAGSGPSTRYKNHEDEFTTNLVFGLVYPWIVLGGAWLIHLWAGNSLGVWGA